MMPHDVFISYSHLDLPFVERLDAFLVGAGLKTWFDKKSLRPGQVWENVIKDEIPQSKTFLTCISNTAMERRGHFHVEQQLAVNAALRVPSDELFVLPVRLGDCEIPRSFRQYHVVNLVDPGAIEMLLDSISSAVERKIMAQPDAVQKLRDALLSHLGAEGVSNQAFVDQFMKTDEISFQDSMGLIERIANSNDPERITTLLNLRGQGFLSYAEQAALDLAIKNVKEGNRTADLQKTIRDDEWGRISQMGFPEDLDATRLLQINKYFRYVSRKNTEPYQKAINAILALVQQYVERKL